MASLLRFGLLLVVLLVCGILIAVHGVRGLVLVIVIAMVAAVPQTRVWQTAERLLVRLTGSRRRAAALVLAVVICSLIAINVYELVH